MGKNGIACLVTGCAGFIGSHLVERLLSCSCAVIGVDDFSTGQRRNMETFADHPAFTFWERDIREPGLVQEAKAALPDLRCLFHLAAVVSVPFSIEHPQETMAVNLDATLALHADAQRAGLPAFVFAGSAAEYGDAVTIPLIEEAAGPQTIQQSPYGRAKFLASAQIEASGYGVSLRCFNVYGPRQHASSPYSGVISRFMEAERAGRALTVFGDGGQTRDFIAVDDVVEGYLLAAGLAGIYNLGTGCSTPILELIYIIGELAGAKPEVAFLPPRKGDIRHSVADFSKFAAAGFKPRLTIRQGLAELWAWWRFGQGLDSGHGNTYVATPARERIWVHVRSS